MTFDEIKIDSVFEFEKRLTKEMVLEFAQLIGDQNKIHVDEEYGKKSEFGQNVVHGMLVGSFFSRLVGMYCPGENSLYLSQNLNFKKPIFYDDEIIVRGTVIKKYDAISVIEIKTEIIKNNQVVISGNAKVKVLK